MSQSSASTSPAGARRVRTDLKTSQNVFLASGEGRSRTRHSSPIAIEQLQQHVPAHYHTYHYGMQQRHRYQLHPLAAPTAAAASAKRSYAKSSAAAAGSACNTVGLSTAARLSTSAPHPNATYLSAHLPARATRLLNRSRLQQQQCSLSSATVDSDSSRSAQSVRRSAAGSRASCSTASIAAAKSSTLSRHHQYYQQQQQQHLQQHRDSHSSSDDLMLYDKSFRNAMIQDVLQFKKQLLRLRRILQETETLNPFENDNGQLFASCGLDSKLLDDMDLASLTSSTTDDPMQELADLRRQVVYLQSQVDDRERTIRLQRNLIEQLEAEKATSNPMAKADAAKECISMATQTERTRPLAIGSEGLSRSKPEYTSYTTHFPAVCSDSTTIIQHHQQYPGNNRAANQTRRHTIISTTLTNYNQQQLAVQAAPRRASIAWEQQTAAAIAAAMPIANDTNNCSNGYKPVRITRIGEPLPMAACNGHTNNYSQQEAAWQAAQLKAVATPILHSGISNGQSRPAAVANGVKRAYQQLPKAASLQQPQQQHIYPQTFYHHQSPANGNLKPTVTIV